LADVTIENPIINSPFREPERHFKFEDTGITNQVIPSRRLSSYFMPIAKAKKRGGQMSFDTEWTKDRIEENTTINRIRERVGQWRKGGYAGVTPITRRLLEYWTNPEREKRFFYCQIEAVETIIYITEAARKFGDAWIENFIREANEGSNPGLNRLAMKMATGSGKTVVIALLIAWQALNKIENQQDARFTDTFLLIAPGITIRDRLRVLLPNDGQNYYKERDILPPEFSNILGKAKIVIANYQSMRLREMSDAARLTKLVLNRKGENPFVETPDQMARRICRELGNKKNIIVINDEAHHCYKRRPETEEEKLSGEDKAEAKEREEAARLWLNGIEAVKAKYGVKAIYDLSATPFFLKGSGWPEGTLFPWAVSDFSLIDAIECGIVKIPRVPVSDDTMQGELPTYRDLWIRIRDELPKKGRGTESVGEPRLPAELESALQSLYGHYKKTYQAWERNEDARLRGRTPPVFIVVCNNTNVSKMVYDYISGYEVERDGQKAYRTGALDIFSNIKDGKPLGRPNTILVDSEQLESGEAMSDDFKKIAAKEIENFKAEYRLRFPGRDTDDLTDEDLLREVMNTVGKIGKLGENVKCVVSVSMLTEGWDANTVTHILGVRAFGTQLLCEQVVGRGLRRISYAAQPHQVHVNGQIIEFEAFAPEYAEVYGVPFSFIPASGSTAEAKPGPIPTRVRALPDRSHLSISFPRLIGYRFEMPGDKLVFKGFDDDARMALSPEEVPTKVENAPIVGETVYHNLDDLKSIRINQIAFLISKRIYERYLRSADDSEPPQERPWLFPQLIPIVQRWMEQCLTCKGQTFPQMLYLARFGHRAAEKIYRCLMRQTGEEEPRVLPIPRPFDNVGNTDYVDFDTTRPVYVTNPTKCHISHVVADTQSWEQKAAQVLEEMPEVLAYVKNHNLGFTIPYSTDGKEGNYIPDFLIKLNDGHGAENPLMLILEVTGERKKDKIAKTDTARSLWVPAVNNHGGFGRWEFLEISDPWDMANTIRGKIRALKLREERKTKHAA
jgi:type III restriction enzyme